LPLGLLELLLGLLELLPELLVVQAELLVVALELDEEGTQILQLQRTETGTATGSQTLTVSMTLSTQPHAGPESLCELPRRPARGANQVPTWYKMRQ